MNRIEITDLSLPELKLYTELNEPQLLHFYEPNGGIFIAESAAVIERALDAGCEPISFLIERKMENGFEYLFERAGEIPVYVGELSVLRQLTGYTVTRGMLCAMKRPLMKSVTDVCGEAKRVVVLEDITNPTNVGAIFRSAAALGMDAILLTKRSSDPYYRRAIRVSMGTVFQIPWAYTDGDYMATLKDMGFQTAAMALSDNSVSPDDPLFGSVERLAILLGSESTGLSSETIEKSDHIIKIPMSHGVDSLNVAAASAVAFWALRVSQ
ncbi:MAG: RNA methyltransferase [Lachnospiraceae bacterium]|nr:RNA methyltransferase [Lachnospiraceae bacterium]